MIHSATEINSTLYGQALEAIMNDGLKGLPKAMEILYNEAMKIERSRYLCAESYERTEVMCQHYSGQKFQLDN